MFEIHGGGNRLRWGAVVVAKKRTKADKALRQADQVEKRTEARPEQTAEKEKPREDFSKATAQIVREATENS